jgi:P22 coat protein - gene protein 5
MANRTVTASMIAAEALRILDNELGWMTQIHRGYEDEWESRYNGYKVGATVNIRRPADFTVRTGATLSAQDVIEGLIPLTVNIQKGVDFQFTSTELTLEMTGENGLSERVIKPAMISLVNDIASDIAIEMYRSAWESVGTVGNVIDSYADFMKLVERANIAAIPQAMRGAMLSPSDHAGLLGSQTALFIAEAARGAYRDAELGRLAGATTYMSQVTPTHQAGPLGGTPLVNGGAQAVTYDSVKDTYAQSLITDGWSAAAALRLRRGDVFTIANVFKVNPRTKISTGVLQQFVVNADVNSDASGNLTANISPPIIITGPHQTVDAQPADNAAITVRGTASQVRTENLLWHKNAMAMVMVPMELPPGAVNPARRSMKGLSVRVIPVYVGSTDVNQWRLDVLYGRRCIDPRMVIRGTGT